MIVEVKQDSFTRGWVQCIAAMVAAQALNQTSDIDLFGIVTNGQTWQFGRLRADLFELKDNSVSRVNDFDNVNIFLRRRIGWRSSKRQSTEINGPMTSRKGL